MAGVNSVWTQLALVAGLVLVNAAFAGSEIALISLRDGQLRRLERRGRTGRRLVRLAHNPNQFLATIQIGITLAGFLASATAAVSLAEPLVGPLGFLGGAAGPAAIVLVTMALTFVTLVVGELAPKRVAMQHAEQWSLLAAGPLGAMSRISRPVVWLLSASTDAAVRLVGGDPRRQRERVSAEELRDTLASQPGFTAAQRAIISGAFEITERALREVVVPRGQVLFLPAELPAGDALARLTDGGHSRAPVFSGDADNVVGVVHWRNLIGAGGAVGDHTRQVVMLPDVVRVDQALRRLQVERQQLAVVLNEHGGTAGIVTVEDLVEELVGEIYDETDADVRAVRYDEDGSIVLPGSFSIHDLPDIDVQLPAGGYATVAGLILERLGHLPKRPGESVDVDGWTLRVIGVERRAITWVRLRRTAG